MDDYEESTPELQEARKATKELKEKINAARQQQKDTTLKEVCTEVPPLQMKPIRCRRTLKGHLSKVTGMQWAKQGYHLVSVAQDGTLLIWDAVTTKKIGAIPLQSMWVMSTAISKSERLVCSGGLDNVCSLYDLGREGGSVQEPLKQFSHNGHLSGSYFIRDDRCLLTSSGDATCVLWDIEVQQKLNEWKAHSGGVNGISCSPDESLFVSVSCDGSAKLWDLRTANYVFSVDIGDNDINCARFYPDGNAFAIGGDDKFCRLIDIRATQEIANFQRHSETKCTPTSVAFSKSGRLLFVAYDDGVVKVFDTLKGDEVFTLDSHTSRVNVVDVSADGSVICTASSDTTIRIWT